MEKKRSVLINFLILVGGILVLIGFSEIVINEYYGGGALEYRGRIPQMDRRLPKDVDYCLYNHGRISPLSTEQYMFLKKYESISAPLGVIGIVLWLVSFWLVKGKEYVSLWRSSLRSGKINTYISLTADYLKEYKLMWIFIIIMVAVFATSFIMSGLNASGKSFWRTLPNVKEQFK